MGNPEICRRFRTRNDPPESIRPISRQTERFRNVADSEIL